MKFFDESAEAGTTGLEVSGDETPEVSVETPVESEPVEAVAEPESPADPFASVFDHAKEFGVDLSAKYQSGKDAVEGLLNAYKHVGRRDNLAKVGERFVQHEAEFREWLETRQRQQAPAGEPAPSLLPTPLAPEVQQYLVRDENGQVAVAMDAPHQIRQKFEDYQHQRRNWLNIVSNEPTKFVDHLKQQLRDELLGEVRGELTQRERAIQQRAMEQSLFAQVEPWLFQRNGQGQVLRTIDEHGNSVALHSPKGAQYVQTVARLVQGGLSDAATAHEIAMQLIGGPPTQAPAPAQEQKFVAPGGTRQAPRTAKPVESEGPVSLREILHMSGELQE